MTSRDFVYWLQGFLELTEPAELSEKQLSLIRQHLSLVFVHDIDPKAGPQEIQDLLNAIHSKEVKEKPVKLPNAHSGGVGPTVYRC